MFLEKHDRLDYSAASSLWLLFLPVKHMVADTHCQSKKEKDPPPLPQKHITKLLRERRWTCENLIISNLWKHENITTRVHKKCRLLVLFICSFSTGGKGEEAGKRSRRVNRRSCRKKRGKEEKREETESWQKRERGGSTEEPSCDSHPTSMHRWECYKCSLVSPVTLPHFKQIQFYADFYRSHPILYSVLYSSYFFCQTLPDYNYQIPYDWCENVKLFFCFFFLSFVGSDFSNKTVDILLYTDRHTDRHNYTEQIQRDRRKGREGARQRTRSRFWASCLQTSCNCNWKMAVEIQKEWLNCKPVG